MAGPGIHAQPTPINIRGKVICKVDDPCVKSHCITAEIANNINPNRMG